MVLESKIAAQGIRDGIELCINSVIPALFPFIILSSMFSSMDISFLQKPLRPLERLCRLPMGCGQLFLLGLLGGYPSGAQMIAQAWEDEKLSKQNASRMLGFCNNAGPAFIFGIGLTFLNIHCVWTVWLIHITSAIVVGIILPGKNPNISLIHNMKEKSFSLALEQSIKTMAIICSWIILFRMFIKILACRFAGYLTQTAYCLICGVLEITNGIYALSDLHIHFFHCV